MLRLNTKQIADCRKIATDIVKPVHRLIKSHSTIAIERTILRLLGVDQAESKNGQLYPLTNLVVDDLVGSGLISGGILRPFSNALLETKATPNELALLIVKKKIEWLKLKPNPKLQPFIEKIVRNGIRDIDAARDKRDANRKTLGDSFHTNKHHPQVDGRPLIYVIVATGNIFEDVIQGRAAAQAGADAIAVIRSTAQSLLDFVPHGATTEGYGGTYATQENFRIMREALDDEGKKLGRYIRLTNYCSGLCMPEIAAMGALERLDFLLNDSMYGILFRDINMKRTLIDQHFSRQIIARSKIVIHTGEDNYLTTADAIENGHQVLASQFINERLALDANMSLNQIGLGHAQEMDPEHPNVFLKEIARAQMTRDIFPECPIKFMPPTRFKSGDIFYSHLMDAMFNFVGVTTHQSIQLLGMATEAMHTPLLQDRFMAIKSAKYIFNGAKDLGNEIEFKTGGIVDHWATKVLNDTTDHLKMIQKKGFFKAIEEKAFAEVSRTETSGKGYLGVFEKSADYVNPFGDLL